MSIPPRQRIVIDLDHPATPGRRSRPFRQFGEASASPRKRRWPKVLGILVACLLLISVVAAAVGYFWWRHYQTTPLYSLALLVDAAQRNDSAAVDRLTDPDKIVSNLSSQMVDKVAGKLGLVPGAGLLIPSSAIPPAVLQTLKQTLRERLVSEVNDFSAQIGRKPFIVLAVTLPTLVKVTNENNIARLSTTMRGQTVELAMQKDGEVWKVVGVKDDNLVTRLVSELLSNVPSTKKVEAVDPRRAKSRRRR